MPSQVGAQQMSNAYQQPYPQAPAQADQMGAQQMNDAYQQQYGQPPQAPFNRPPTR